MSQADLTQRIRECETLRDGTQGQERRRYNFELLGLRVAAALDEPLSPEALDTILPADGLAYRRGLDDGASILKVEKLKGAI